MTKLSKSVLKTLTNSFVISIVFNVLAFVSTDGSWAQSVLSFIGFYSAILTANVFVVFIITLVLAPLFKEK